MGKITIEVKINTFGNMLYGLNHPSPTDQCHQCHGTGPKSKGQVLSPSSKPKSACHSHIQKFPHPILLLGTTSL